MEGLIILGIVAIIALVVIVAFYFNGRLRGSYDDGKRKGSIEVNANASVDEA